MTFVPVNNIAYKLTSVLDQDMVLTVSLEPKTLNTMVIHKWNNGKNQRFAFRPVGENSYGLFSYQNGMTIEVPEGKSNDGVEVVCSQPNKKENQFWALVPTEKKFKGKDAYYIRSWCGKYLDVCEAKAKNNQKVIIWSPNGNKNQMWIIEPVQ